MLAKGEVEEIIVRPDIEIVTIILHDGAIIKGKKVGNTNYLYKVKVLTSLFYRPKVKLFT